MLSSHTHVYNKEEKNSEVYKIKYFSFVCISVVHQFKEDFFFFFFEEEKKKSQREERK